MASKARRKGKTWWAVFNRSNGEMHHALRATRRGARAIAADFGPMFWRVSKVRVEIVGGADGR